MNDLKWKLLFLLVATLMFLWFFWVRPPVYGSIPKPHKPSNVCPRWTSEQSITPLNGTKHLLVSAFLDQRVQGFDVRIIGIFRRDAVQPLHCLFCCDGGSFNTSPASVYQHSDNFGFPFVTTDVMCQIPPLCAATHVTLLTDLHKVSTSERPFLHIRNKREEERKLQFNFTVCISNLFGDYNNVLQFAQSLEMYRLLGVDRVVIYNTSCGPELDRLLHSYSRDGFVEVVPWPIDRHLRPSRGWLFSEFGGDLHYFGQLTTLNECVYRSMQRSRYVLLNDIDEIITPYQHDDLTSLMETLQQQQPDTGVFLIENHIFPKKHFEPERTFHLPQWEGVPGINILEHIYREDPKRNIYHPYKIIVKPQMVEQTSVHEVLKMSGPAFKVPLDVCRIIHVRVPLQGHLKREELNVDKRLWDFSQKLIPNVDRELRKAGLLSPEGQS